MTVAPTSFFVILWTGNSRFVVLGATMGQVEAHKEYDRGGTGEQINGPVSLRLSFLAAVGQGWVTAIIRA